VKDYQKSFEALANRINGLPPQFYLSCFISGLRADIRREVLAFQPARPPLCRRQFFILIVAPDLADPDTETLTNTLLQLEPDPLPQPDPTIPTLDPNPQISLHALMGHTIPQTLKMLGQIQNHHLHVLIDSGSTHNFIQDRVAKSLGLTLVPTQSFQVLVGNGEELNCCHMAQNTPLYIDSHLFLVDLFVLPLSGAEIVLGVQWLKTLGPSLTDYDHLTLSFCREGKIIQLMGQPKPTPTEASLHQFKRLFSTNSIDTFFQLHQLPSPHEIDPAQTHPPEITQLLHRFSHIFTEPTSPPPPRPTDHQIPLLHNSDPVNV
jgi:hypothetical protein